LLASRPSRPTPLPRPPPVLPMPGPAFLRPVPFAGKGPDSPEMFEDFVPMGGIIVILGGMLAEMIGLRPAFEIADIIVERVAVLVVDVPSVRDRPVVVLPDGPMEATAAGCCEVSPIRSVGRIRVSTILDTVEDDDSRCFFVSSHARSATEDI
jgi:hypothetical protein